MADESNKTLFLLVDGPFAKLSDHLMIEIVICVSIVEWGMISCVNKYWADLFRQDYFWHAALIRIFPFAAQGKRWPGPIPCEISKRYVVALLNYFCQQGKIGIICLLQALA